ncbi:MAG: MerR family transcriptional regulator [Chitinophagaceae bacterium]|nr:MerR family transcriptional regulator [Chitinophagaceae bacterium]
MNAFTIKDLENISGIKAHTIRIWEQRYSFLKPQRTGTNIRYYTGDELKTILNISLLNKYGFKISLIDKLTEAQIQEKILSLSHVQAQQERMVNSLIQHLIDLDTDKLELLLTNYIHSKGIERSITQIIFPFLERIGILWLTNHITPGQEHLVTNIVRQKLIAGIDAVSSHVQKETTVLLFLPESEHHELGLLFMQYLLKSRGIRVLYVGANVPLKDVEFIANFKKPTFLYTHLTAVADKFNFEKFLLSLHQRCANFDILVSGHLTQIYKKEIPPNITFKKSLSEVMDYILTLQ